MKRIILASGSETRRLMLERAEIEFDLVKPDADEEALKKEIGHLSFKEQGLFLAKAKAKSVSQKNLDAYVIAADQICELDGKVFDKPGSHENCIKHLQELSGKVHKQHCCACVFYQGELFKEFYFCAQLTMRKLSQKEIEAYVELEKPYHSCGSYMFERNGHKLFESISGEEEWILGLPLTEIVQFLNN